MGLAASQARALLLVARKSDIEYRMQCLTQRKMVLAMQTEQIAKDYSTKISNRMLKFVYNLNGSSSETQSEDLTYFSLINNASYIGNYRVTDASGRVVIPSYDYMPQQEVQIPVYTLYTEDSNGLTPVTTTETKYEQSSSDKIGTKSSDSDNYPSLYIKSYVNGKEDYVKIQDENGIVENATYTDKDGNSYPLYKDGELIEDMKNKLTIYKGVEVPTYSTTTDSSVASQETTVDGKKAIYKQTGYTTKLVDRQPAENGKYYTDDGKEYVVASAITNTGYFQNALRNGAIFLEKATTVDVTDALGNKTGKTSTTWASEAYQGSSVIQDILYTDDDDEAEAEYETQTAIISAQDKLLDTEIKQLETQHKAIETEEDSVKTIIKSNIEKTFAVFKA